MIMKAMRHGQEKCGARGGLSVDPPSAVDAAAPAVDADVRCDDHSAVDVAAHVNMRTAGRFRTGARARAYSTASCSSGH